MLPDQVNWNRYDIIMLTVSTPTRNGRVLYQGIEYCIRNGLQRFEPGTQGEHKLARGFEPTLTWSAHWLADQELRDAVARYLGRESLAVTEYADAAAHHLPFRT